VWLGRWPPLPHAVGVHNPLPPGSPHPNISAPSLQVMCRALLLKVVGVLTSIGHLTNQLSKNLCTVLLWLHFTYQCVFTNDCLRARSLQSCPTLYGPMDCSQQGSSVYGILQARILEWVAMPSSRGSS